MIIKFPTGSYSSILPTSPSDSTSVTFTISNNYPPRTNLLFQKIPLGVTLRTKTDSDIGLVQRRSSLGALVFSITKASRELPGNNAKQYETGQTLDFGDTPAKTIDPMLVSEHTVIQHDTNVFDYQSLGLSSEDIQTINEQSLITYDILASRLNELRTLRANAEIVINTNQEIVNETRRNIQALQIIVDNSSDTDSAVSDLIDKFEAKKAEAQQNIDSAVLDANEYAAEAAAVLDEIRKISVVMK